MILLIGTKRSGNPRHFECLIIYSSFCIIILISGHEGLYQDQGVAQLNEGGDVHQVIIDRIQENVDVQDLIVDHHHIIVAGVLVLRAGKQSGS